jgi:hypothetical protein
VRSRWRIAEGNKAPEEFPKVFFNVYSEDMASLKGPADRVWGRDPVEGLALSPMSISRKCHESVMSIVMVYGVPTSSVGKEPNVTKERVTIGRAVLHSLPPQEVACFPSTSSTAAETPCTF